MDSHCDVCGRSNTWGCGHTGSQRAKARRHNELKHREGRCWHYDHSDCGPACQAARDQQPRSGWMPLVHHRDAKAVVE